MISKPPPIFSSKYIMKNVTDKYGIFEEENLILILNDYMNAENILTILKSDERNIRKIVSFN